MSGKNTPDGRDRLVFRVAYPIFVADTDAFRRLIVSGHRTRLEGSGQINHTGDYGFMLSGPDGDLSPTAGDEDAFRIGIWDKSTAEVLHENQLGASDGGDATGGLPQGEIKIAKSRAHPWESEGDPRVALVTSQGTNTSPPPSQAAARPAPAGSPPRG